jgi:hypothetical protein
VLRPIEDYGINELRADLDKDPINVNMEFKKITKIDAEKKRWGTALVIDLVDAEKKKSYKFSVVKSWVKYPAKDPLQFQEMDWSQVISIFENSRYKL